MRTTPRRPARPSLRRLIPKALAALALALAAISPTLAAEPLRVCATTTDLGALAAEVGGDEVEVTTLVPAQSDPHFLEARPSLIKALSRADLLCVNGLELEAGWVPTLQAGARNESVLLGGKGYFDASQCISPLQVPSQAVDRSLGDVHALGNPHYLLDPVSGWRVAEGLRDALTRLRPERREHFAERCADFHRRLGAALVGEALATKYDAVKLATLHERGKLLAFLESQGDAVKLGGWIGALAPHAGKSIVVDHDLWPYFARRYGLTVLGILEPKPGVPPTPRHLGDLVARMKATRAEVVLAVVYYDPSFADFVREGAGARIAPMAHQVGSREHTEDYLRCCDHNVRRLVEALAGGASGAGSGHGSAK